MRAYVSITGVIFALLVAAHVWRATLESHLATDPAFIATTLVATALSLWAGRLMLASRSR
jgi:hypothetical protein